MNDEFTNNFKYTLYGLEEEIDEENWSGRDNCGSGIDNIAF